MTGVEEMSASILEIGVVGIALMVIWRLLGIMQFKWVGRQIGANGGMIMTPLACQTDPRHYQRIKEIDIRTKITNEYHSKNEPTMTKIREGIMSNAFGCTWKDRDEVIGLLAAIKENTRAINYLTQEIRKQNGK